ncbi:hypothetical protein FS837_008671 [Tulasnella sp. UAMH 9824]|nr:hypothetical protein FS837_008671 [Tulasnella sp. UAMH 9824]
MVEGPGDDGEDERLGSSREPPVFAPKRGLKERHIGVMAISGMLGTGIFLASGRALADAGPAGALLGYVVCPATGGFIAHAQKFVDPALGAAIGWNFAYALAIVQAVEITAASLLGRSLVTGLAYIIVLISAPKTAPFSS